MTNCTQQSLVFPACKRCAIEASFDGSDITCDGGVLLLRQIEQHFCCAPFICRYKHQAGNDWCIR